MKKYGFTAICEEYDNSLRRRFNPRGRCKRHAKYRVWIGGKSPEKYLCKEHYEELKKSGKPFELLVWEAEDGKHYFPEQEGGE